MRKVIVVVVCLTILVGTGIAWLFSQLESNSYEYGYAAAFVEADRLWWVTMPPDSVCDGIATNGIRRDGALNFAEIVAGCHSGYYDAVTNTRGRLGYPPLP